MSHLDEAAGQAEIAAMIDAKPSLKDRCITYVAAQLDYTLKPKEVNARGGKVARFAIDGQQFEYREHGDPRFGYVLYAEGYEQPIFCWADLADS
jgi:hypothetical protein